MSAGQFSARGRTVPFTPELRQAAAETVRPALTPPEEHRDRQPSSATPAPETDTGAAGVGDDADSPDSGFVVVTGQPRQGTHTLAWGAPPRCEQCGVLVGGSQCVVDGPEGWCVATLCGCDQPWYTRESAWYSDAEEAVAAFEADDYELP